MSLFKFQEWVSCNVEYERTNDFLFSPGEEEWQYLIVQGGEVVRRREKKKIDCAASGHDDLENKRSRWRRAMIPYSVQQRTKNIISSHPRGQWYERTKIKRDFFRENSSPQTWYGTPCVTTANLLYASLGKRKHWEHIPWIEQAPV